jgi:hypothetical protein
MFCTSEPRDDGFGGHFQNILWDILYSETNGYNYVFIPPKKIDHNYTNDSNYIQRLINYMSVEERYGIQNIPTDTPLHINIRSSIYEEIQSNMELYHSGSIFERYQSDFFSNKKSPYDPQHFHVAVHIRRFNKCDLGDWGTITPDTYYLKMINKVRDDFKDKPLKFHIYSQGDESNFSLFVAPDTVFHLNEDILHTFNGMVFADVLTTTTSSLSYVAALLSKGIIYHQPFWHKPLAKWRIIEKN